MPCVELLTWVELWPWEELLSWVLPVIPNCDSDLLSVLAVFDSTFMPSDGDDD